MNNGAARVRYQDHGYLALDNHLSAWTLRVIAIGGKNWVVLGSESGGETAALSTEVRKTICATC